MSKRKKFVFTSLVLAVGLLVITSLVDLEMRYLTIAALGLLALILAFWSLREGLTGIEWLTIPILPFGYTVSVALFYFLLPSQFLTSVGMALFFALGMYTLLLTENIFSVAAIRTIALLRAASSVGFLLTLVTAFFWDDVIFSFRLSAPANFILISLVSLPLFLQSLWSVNLGERLENRVIIYTLVLSLILGQFALVISFWPVTVALASLFLTASAYVLLGLSQAELAGRLFPKTIREYLLVGLGVFITLIWTTFKFWG
jgi:hypothetical protein